MASARALVATLRPHQWVKNLFVAAPLVFAKKLTDPSLVVLAVAAVATFCALSGAVYALNDVLDVEKDRAHPVKRHRPVASGALSRDLALRVAFALALAALAGAGAISAWFAVIAAAYLALNVGYSLRLKHVVFLDVSAIAAGFLLRVLGGAQAIGVPASPWLLACTGLLAGFLGFGKRAHELAQASADDSIGQTRAVLARYQAGHLRAALHLLGAATVVAYFFYTRAPHTVAFFGTTRMVWTVPLCMVGIARFLHLVIRERGGDSPTEKMLKDLPFMANLAVWALSVVVVIYLR